MSESQNEITKEHQWCFEDLERSVSLALALVGSGSDSAIHLGEKILDRLHKRVDLLPEIKQGE
ncbi:hypothetical protein YA0850_20130 [Pseudomonas veronii]|uniref:DUF3077 domain-containing protein n=1 Tax=Pseudomonas veronii TaxID=76761 RepID=A0ABS0VMX6_PSEVE|nr:hypothetical protein [Pseudomonas veronii]MBI6554707.1 hypothetical protein [Pseudomonas veronii]MBI6652890.1 hypothetical protein [Pseudomonas veronii]